MKHDIDRLLKHALSPEIRPDTRLNQTILNKAEEMTFMRKRKKSGIPAAVLAAFCIVILGSTTVFAAWRLMSPDQVAQKNEDPKLVEAFQSEDAILVNETQECGGYRVTLLGAVAGKNISKYLSTDNNGQVKDNRFYSVVAIARTDGTPMPDTSSDEYGKDPFYVSPYFKGLNPAKYSLMSMGGGYSEFVEDGVQYRLLEMDNIEIFADRGIYMGVSSGTFYNAEAYLFDEETGQITRNESYDGVNALFVLPMDPSKADPQAAQACLDAIDNPEEPETIEMSEEDLAIDQWVEQLNAENLEEYCQVYESTVQICKPNEKGRCPYAYDLGHESGSGSFSFDILFPEGTEPGTIGIVGYNYSDFSDLSIEVATLNEDGTATYAVYKPRAERME